MNHHKKTSSELIDELTWAIYDEFIQHKESADSSAKYLIQEANTIGRIREVIRSYHNAMAERMAIDIKNSVVITKTPENNKSLQDAS